MLFNIFLSILISCELTFDLDYYLSVHNGMKYSFFDLITLYGGGVNSGLPPKETKQNAKANKQTKNAKAQQTNAKAQKQNAKANKQQTKTKMLKHKNT